ncbi:MAG: CARDB domain-containing protein [Oceanipulchritudo sp.]
MDVWIFDFKHEYVFVDWSYPSAARRLPLTGIEDLGNGYRIAAAANATADWEPVERTWRDAGAERFLLAEPEPGRRLDVEAAEAIAAQDVFARMGSATTTGAAYTPPQTSPTRRISSDPDLPAQVDLPLLANVYPDSEPALAGNGDTLMLLYVRDTGVPNPVQFTEIAWTYFDGTTWSTPAALASDSRGQFKPQVVFDGNGDAIAVYERIKDAAYDGTEIETMAAEMEIVWSRWDHVSQTWSTPIALTDNTFVDHSAQLAGPLSDGDLLLVWTQNEANELQGSGAPGDPANSRIMTTRWDSTTQAWGAAVTLVDQLTYELSGDLAVSGQGAVYLWSRDLDGNLDDYSDSELFYRVWVESSGLWLPTAQYTTDSVHDRNAELTMDPAGNAYAVWQRGTDLVMDVNFAGTPSVVRPDTETLGFADYALTLGPGGNLLVLWQEMNEAGSDAHYRVYDPASATWGLDTLLSQDSDVESAFAPVWDAVGNLTLAYTNTEITTETVSVEIEGGEIIDVEGVPQPGQVDLLAAKRALIKDLQIGSDGLVAEGTDFLPGDAVTVTVKLRNSGNVAIQDPVVGLYIGDPQDGGGLVEERTLTGWLKAADTTEEVFSWTVPEPAIPRTLYAVVDAAGAVTEFDEENNQQFLPLNGIDYELEFVSGSVLRDGSVRVVARVTNRGAPASPVTQLDLWPQEAPGADPLASVTVSLLNPGDSVELALELPAGSQGEGETAYRLVVDEDDLSEDILLDNNEVLFALNLWIDDDGDGVPRGWEEANGLSDSDPNDVLLDSDGDGFTDKDEYLAGTDPNDPNSYLKIGEFNIIEGGSGDPDTFVISWASASGSLYRVGRSYDLTNWDIVADDIAADPPLNTFEDVPDPAESSVFYRIEAK